MTNQSLLPTLKPEDPEFIQAFDYGLSGRRVEEEGLVPKFAPTLPKYPSYLKLVNVAFRGKVVDVMISRLPSGRVV